jgi:hypothetical protein
MERSANIDSPEERRKSKRAVGHAVIDIGEHLRVFHGSRTSL